MKSFKSTVTALILWALVAFGVGGAFLANYLSEFHPVPARGIAAAILGGIGTLLLQIAVIAIGVRMGTRKYADDEPS